MYMYKYIYMHVFVQSFIYIHIHVYIYIYIYTYMCVRGGPRLPRARRLRQPAEAAAGEARPCAYACV